MKKIALILLFLFTFAQADENKNLQKVSLQLLWLHQFEFAGFYIAKEKGFYKDAGLDVEIKEYTFGTHITDDVMSKKSDFGLESSSLILDKMQGKNIYMLMTTYQKSPFVLMAKERSDLKSVHDLKGKKIMAAPNQVTMASLNAMLKINNISHADYTTQPHSFNTDDLINGTTDAMTTYLSNEPFHLQEKGIKYRIFDPADFGFAFYSDILFTSKEFYEKNPQTVDKFYEATMKGWKYAFENMDETAKLIFEKYNTQNKSLPHLMFEAQELKKLAYVEGVEFGAFKHEIIAQIAQTYRLLELSKSTEKLDDFIYPKAMHKESAIDLKLLLKVGAALFILFLALYYWNRKLSSLNKQIEQTSKKITTLLDNAGQGFLTFDREFRVDEQYSKECIKLLGESLGGKDITTLLFNDPKKAEFFKNTLKILLNEHNEIKRKSYISLLPQNIVIHKKALRLEYKVLSEDSVMMILTNVTSQKKLEKRVQKEQQTLKMIVAIVSDSHIFYDTTHAYETFVNTLEAQVDCTKTPKQNLEALYRTIHTFKGSFSQLFMQEMVAFLHGVESELSMLAFDENLTHEALIAFISNFDFSKNYAECIGIIKEILGADFMDSQSFLKIELSSIESLQEKIARIMEHQQKRTPECEDILHQVQNLSNQKLYELLNPYAKFACDLAKRMGKEIEPFEILGDKKVTIDNRYKPFVQSLIHVFRNSIDHGIESPEERVEKNKDEKGHIRCSFLQTEGKIAITIADDGAGIDSDALRKKLQSLGIATDEMDERQLFKSICLQNLSTKESVSEISGRGVGMSAVKIELERIGGEVEINSTKDVGTTITFTIGG
jgi:ABC-type nitrate/sulfonate/bicarbonate transport system substrate-binding protein/signal transduction histidine kinase